MKLNGSDIIMECLLEQGVDTVFGYPGGAVLNIYDALYKYSDRIRHIETSHEQAAAHAADGYARASGKTGVVIATSGPGATNLVTGIATAYMDSIPMVAITGNVGRSLLGLDSFQEVDITGVTMPITKHNYIVKDINQLADTLREAFYLAQEGRRGPGAGGYSQRYFGTGNGLRTDRPAKARTSSRPFGGGNHPRSRMHGEGPAAVFVPGRRGTGFRRRTGGSGTCKTPGCPGILFPDVPGRV